MPCTSPERGARIARRDDREYWASLREEQRREAGCPARELCEASRFQGTSRGRVASLRHACTTEDPDHLVAPPHRLARLASDRKAWPYAHRVINGDPLCAKLFKPAKTRSRRACSK